MTAFEKCFAGAEHILMEAALGERLKREYGIRFDPFIDMGGLVVTEQASWKALTSLWLEYAKIAEEYALPFMATTPTRRTNKERLAKTMLRKNLIQENVDFLKSVRDQAGTEMYVGALVGCHGDAYTGIGALGRKEARDFHSWESELFAREEVDFIMAGLMPNAGEALGMAEAISEVDIPYIISFTLQKNGTLPDGTFLSDAIAEIDGSVDHKPLCYMTNCVHPLHVISALQQEANQTALVKERFLGIQANTSRKSFEELDGSAELYSSDAKELALDIRSLMNMQKMKIIGGCCGTDGSHLREMARICGRKN